MDKINSNVIDFSPAEGPAGLSVGQVYIGLDGTLKRGIFAGQSAASFEAVRQANNERYAASGFVHFGKHYTEANSQHYIPINQGMWTHAFKPNALILGVTDEGTGVPNTATSKINRPLINIAGVCFYLTYLSSTIERTQVKFPPAPDGKTTYHRTKGEVKVHVDTAAAFIYANQSDNIEVVTDRVDMWGFEAYLEEVTTTNPFVYPNGLIQSQATTMNGISTSASNRPVTYYSVFEGDTESKGKGLDVTKLSYVQLATILGDHKHNLYYLADGRLVQWRLRQRTIAGAGNGDWATLKQNHETANSICFSEVPAMYIRPKGSLDALQYGELGAWRVGQYSSDKDFPHVIAGLGATAARASGITIGARAIDISANGECYFLVCGTVNRLNQGAYHPSFNPSGTDFWGTGQYWHNIYSGGYLKSPLECFTRRYGTGNIGHAPARPDGRLYNVIYADGQGGVCRDMRYSALGLDLVDFAEADQKVKNGTYRGFERLVFSKAYAAISSNCTNGNVLSKDSERIGWISGYVQAGSGSGLGRAITSNKSNSAYVIKNNSVIAKGYFSGIEENLNGTWFSRVLWDKDYTPASTSAAGADSYLVITYELDTSVGGSFLQTDVIGNPANILTTPHLANGWQGGWIGVGTGSAKDYPFTRKVLALTGNRVYTANNGTTWGSVNIASQLKTVTNSMYTGPSAVDIHVYNYQAFAKQTEPANNAVVYGYKDGVGQVFQSGGYFTPVWGNLLMESLLGIVGISSIGGTGGSHIGVTSITIRPDNYTLNTGGLDGSVSHQSVTKGPPNNNSSGFKALNYNVNLNQQAFIQYAYTELKHNGTNWGDDGKVTIVDNQATKTDLNGNTVLVGTARLREPLGWLTQSSQPRNASRAEFRLSFNQWTKDVKPLEEKGGIYGK